MLAVPYYNKPSQVGIYHHFKEIISSLNDKPIMLYNVPSRCGVNMEPETVASLYEHFDNVLAIKEASGSIDQVSKLRTLCDIVILSGDDALTLPMLSVGASGVVSVTSNIVPKKMVEMVNKYFNGQVIEARKLHTCLYPLFKILFSDTNPIPIKLYMKLVGLTENDDCRLPLVPSHDKLAKLLEFYTYFFPSSDNLNL